jgi:hypothetical protein
VVVVAVAWLSFDYSGVTTMDGVTVARSSMPERSYSDTKANPTNTAPTGLVPTLSEPTVGWTSNEIWSIDLDGNEDAIEPVNELTLRSQETIVASADPGMDEGLDTGLDTLGSDAPIEHSTTLDALPPDAPTPGKAPSGSITTAPAALSVPADRANTTGERIEALLAQAKERISKNRYTRPRGQSALDSYRQILSIDPSNTQARSGIRSIKSSFARWAGAARARGQLAKAQRQLETAVAIDPNDQALRAQLRTVREQRQQLERANLDTTRQRSSSGPTPWYATGDWRENDLGWGNRD